MDDNKSFLLWTVVHAVLEYIYAKSPTKEQIFSYHDFYREKELSDLNSSQIIFDIKEINELKTRSNIYINRYYDNYFPFDEKVAFVEKNIYFDIGKNVKFRIIIDRMDLQDWNAIIVDYKTNRSKSNSVYDQVSIYALWIQEKYNYKNIYAKIIYLDLKTTDQWQITDDIITETKNKYLDLIQQIEHSRFAYQMWDLQAFVPCAGSQCKTCPFVKICPVWKDKI